MNIKSLDNHIAIVQEFNPHADTFEILEEFKRKGQGYFRLRCLICNKEWEALTHVIRRKSSWCSVCGAKYRGKKLRISTFQHIMRIVENNPKAKWMEFGRVTHSPNRPPRIETKCLRCGREWEPQIGDLIRGVGCVCETTPNGEKLMAEALEVLGFVRNQTYFTQKAFPDCKYKKPLPFDFYLPEHHCLIEYQGYQHYHYVEYFHKTLEGFKVKQEKDQIKYDWAEANGYLLLRIPYTVNRLDLIVKGLIERLNL